MRVAIVGAGIMGLATAWALRRAGHEPTVFEQGSVPNPLGTSVDQHRLIRHAYGASAAYAAMVDDAFAAWDRMWADLGTRLYAETGTLAISGADQGDWVEQSARTLREMGREVPSLSADDLARRFPLLRADGIRSAFLLPTGGALFAGRIVELLAHRLMGAGVPVRQRARVAEIDPDRARLVLADREVVQADALVVAAGAWISRLVPSLAARVTPSRQVVVYLTPPPGTEEAWARMPMILEIDPREGFYLVPPVAGTGMKIGDHRFSRTGDPDLDRTPAAEEAEPIAALGRRRIAGFDRYRVAEAKSCFYTVEDEERFVVERLSDRAWAMSPCSGHGFKFGAVLGEAMARALDDGDWAARFPAWAAGEARP